MNRKEAAELSPIIKAFSEGKIIQTSIKGKPWEDLGEDIAFYTNDKYRIKPEATPSVSTSEYHCECFDNGYTIAEEEVKVCAVGDDDTKKFLGEFIFADILHHCNLACSNKVKITIEIESEE